MPPDVHLCEGAYVSHPRHVYGEVAEEVDDLQRLAPQGEDEDEGGYYGTEELLQDEDLEDRRHKQKTLLFSDIYFCGVVRVDT